MSSLFLTFGCQHNHPQDPLENYNRLMYQANKKLDRTVVRPIAQFYTLHFPQPVRTSVGNFYDNLTEISNATNDILQFNFSYAAHDITRFLINSTLGVAGLFDLASDFGFTYRRVDFGQTLYRWGYQKSAYFIIPLIGPSTIRDAAGIMVDYCALSIWPWIHSDWRYVFLGVEAIDARSRLLHHESILKSVAVDEYVFVRDAYFQRRQFLNQPSDEDNQEVNPYDQNELDEFAKSGTGFIVQHSSFSHQPSRLFF